jgi:DNA-directed RNA polymerase subunit K/omega
LNRFGNIDSKFRFVILASKRAKQLLKGAKPKIKTKSRNRIAQTEVRSGVVEYEILPTQKEEYREQEDRVFVGEGIHDEAIDVDEGPVGKDDTAAEGAAEGEVEEETEDEGARDDEDEPGDPAEEKDE